MSHQSADSIAFRRVCLIAKLILITTYTCDALYLLAEYEQAYPQWTMFGCFTWFCTAPYIWQYMLTSIIRSSASTRLVYPEEYRVDEMKEVFDEVDLSVETYPAKQLPTGESTEDHVTALLEDCKQLKYRPSIVAVLQETKTICDSPISTWKPVIKSKPLVMPGIPNGYCAYGSETIEQPVYQSVSSFNTRKAMQPCSKIYQRGKVLTVPRSPTITAWNLIFENGTVTHVSKTRGPYFTEYSGSACDRGFTDLMEDEFSAEYTDFSYIKHDDGLLLLIEDKSGDDSGRRTCLAEASASKST